jgi:transcription-repair coupling factor (superfamily II helicase)
VIDVFCPAYRHPVRMELFGDDVESLRLFDVGSQRTLRPIDRVVFHPVRETIVTQGADPRARVLAAADQAAYPSSKTRNVLERIDAGEEFFGIEALAPVFHERMASVFDYLPESTCLVIEDPESTLDEVRRELSRLRENAHHRLEEHLLALDPHDFFMDEESASAAMGTLARIALRTVEIERPTAAQDETSPPRLRLDARPTSGVRADLLANRSDGEVGHALAKLLGGWLDNGYAVHVVVPNRTHAERLSGLLSSLGYRARIGRRTSRHGLGALLEERHDSPEIVLELGPLSQGFELPGDHVVVISEEEIFGARAHRPSPPSKAPSFGDLAGIAEGDLIVHDEHGIGRYRGLAKLSIRGVTQDFLHLEYSGGALYLPVYRIGVIHRFVGGTPETVHLDKIGGSTWVEKRRRVSAATRKMAEELLQLYAQRRALPGHAGPRGHLPRIRRELSIRRNRGPRTRHWRGPGRHAAGKPDGSAGLRRRRLWQDRGRAARSLARGTGRTAGGGVGTDDGAGRAASGDLRRALPRFSGTRCLAVALPQAGRAESHRSPDRGRHRRRGDWHAPSVVARRALQATGVARDR